MQNTIFVGLDVHKATISVAIAGGERGGEFCHWGTINNRADHVRRLAEKLGIGGRQLHFCYEAGPCGYGLYRQLTALGHDCVADDHRREMRPVHLRLRPGRRLDPTPRPDGRRRVVRRQYRYTECRLPS